MKKTRVLILSFLVAVIMTIPAGMPEQSFASVVANADNNSISVSSPLIAGQSFTVTATGDGQSRTLQPGSDGDEAYVPYNISVYSDDDYVDENLDVNHCVKEVTLANPDTYNVRVTFKRYVYSLAKKSWVGYESLDGKEVTIDVKGKVRFNANGGKTSASETLMSDGEKFNSLPSATKSKCRFLGWFWNKGGSDKILIGDEQYFGDSPNVYYAHWSKKIKVRFYGNSGKASKKSKKVWTGVKYGNLPTAKRSGYRFKGWYTKKSGGSKVTKNSKIPNKSNVKLYAYWFGPAGYGSSISKAEFNRIKNGMSYGQVKYLIGGGGSLLSSVGGYECYEWSGNGSIGANAEVYFDDDGEVYAKAQAGLY